MRQLDRRRAGPRVPVEGELARGAERVEDGRHRLLVDVERGDLRARHPAPRVLGPLAERDQAQEQLPGGLLAVVVELRVELLGSAPQRPGHAADLPVGLEEQGPAVAPFEELGERVLHQRERAGLLGDVGQHRGHEARLQRDVDALRRPGDRPLELLGRERHHRLDAGLEQLREPPVQQRPVVEVGPQRGDHAEAAVRIGGGGLEAPEEVRPDGLVLDEREHLLELVDHEDELATVGREQPQDRAVQPVLVALELLDQARRRIRRGAQQRRLQPVQRVGAREHVRDVPRLGRRRSPRAGAPGSARRARPRTSRSRSVRRPRGTGSAPAA